MALTIPVSEIVEKSNNPLLGKAESWERVLLGDISTIQNGFAFKSAQFTRDGGMPLIRIRDVGKDASGTYYDGEYDPSYVVEAGNLLIGMDGDFNCARWRGPNGLLNQRVCRITLNSDIYHPKLLDYALPGYLKAINEKTSSVTVKHLSSKTISEIPLPLPPMEQQKLIVAEIEKQFSRLDQAVANLKRVKANLKRYKAAVLKAAVEGKLTEKWREEQAAKLEAQGSGNASGDRTSGAALETAEELLKRILAERRKKWVEVELAKMEAKGKVPKNDKWKKKYKDPAGSDTSDLPELPEGWTWATIEQIADIQLGKMLDRQKHRTGQELPYLRNVNVRWGSVDTSDLLTMYFKDSELERYALQADDVLVCEGGEPGRAAVWSGQVNGLMYQKALHRVRFHTGYEQKLLVFLLEYLAKSGRLESWFTGVTIKHFTRESFAKLPIPLAPYEEQRKIVAEVEKSLSLVCGAENQVEANLIRAERLRQSILSKAFSGQLSPVIA
ncbi:MAG: restriction endonuclease subunit S [Thermodesulfobacteriota bacterium]